MGKKPLVLGLKGSKYQGVMFRLEEASSLKSTVRELVDTHLSTLERL